MKLFWLIPAAIVMVSAAANAQLGTKPPTPPGVVNPYQTACAPGFNKADVSGQSYTCITPPIVCPPPPANMSGGISNPQGGFLQPGRSAQFRYTCTYGPTPR